MKNRYFWLAVPIVLIFLLLWLQDKRQPMEMDTIPDKVAITLRTPAQQGITGMDIRLTLYRYDQQGAAEALPAGSCTTGQEGACEISLPANAPRDASGFLRGTLEVGTLGRRALLWPGGALDIALQRGPDGRLQVETEAKPDEYATPGGVTVRAPRPPLYLGGLLLGLLCLALTFILFRQARKQ